MTDIPESNVSTLRSAVLDAYTALIAEHLKSDQPYRFQTIISVCKQAHELAKLGVIKVDEVMNEFTDEERGYTIRHHNQQRMHELDGVREIVHQIGAFFEQSRQDSHEKLLDRLGRVRDVLLDMGRPTTVIDEKIDQTLAEMAQQERMGDDAVVSTQLLRGHQTDEEGRRQLPDGGDPADRQGETSPGAVPSECCEEGMDRHEVRPDAGNGARRHLWSDPQSPGVLGAPPQTES